MRSRCSRPQTRRCFRSWTGWKRTENSFSPTTARCSTNWEQCRIHSRNTPIVSAAPSRALQVRCLILAYRRHPPCHHLLTALNKWPTWRTSCELSDPKKVPLMSKRTSCNATSMISRGSSRIWKPAEEAHSRWHPLISLGILQIKI